MKLIKELLLKPGDEIEMKIKGNKTTMLIQIWETKEIQEAIIVQRNHGRNN